MALSLASRTTVAVPSQRRHTVAVRASNSAAPVPQPPRRTRLPPTHSAAASAMQMAPQASSRGWLSMLQLFLNKQEQQEQQWLGDADFEAWLETLARGEGDAHSHSMYGSHLAERLAVEPSSRA